MNFPAHPDCRACDLWEYSNNPGVPTRPADFQGGSPARDKALVVIGMNPGYNEDLEGKNWIGKSGLILNGLLRDYVEVPRFADCYLANVCRCRCLGSKLNISPRKKCWPHMQADLEQITAAYGPSNVWLLAMGGEACWLLSGLNSVKKSVAHQGLPRTLPLWPDGPTFPSFYTYHPAATLPGRDPSLRAPLEDHLRFLRDTYEGKSHLPSLPSKPSIGKWGMLDGLPQDGILGLDIETYGVLKGNDQTVFHPAKMHLTDGIPKSKIVVCVSVSWRVGGGKIRTAWFDWSKREHRKNFIMGLRWLGRTRQPAHRNITILGQNICFDLSCLRYVSPELAAIIKSDNFLLDDTAITNFLDSDMRPERSQKAQARLFRTMDYDAIGVNIAAGLQADGHDDPNLLLYNCADSITVLRNHALHLHNILIKHGPTHPALTDFGRQFRSDLIWTALHMAESGIPFSTRLLEQTERVHAARVSRLLDEAYKIDLVVGGKGSQKPILNAFVDACEEADILGDERLKLTKVHRTVSTGKNNINLLLATLPMNARSRPIIQLISDYRTTTKIISSYTSKLLRNPQKGIVGGKAWPAWYLVPTHAKDTSEEEGGTRQGRLAARDPGAQTFPPVIAACATSRYGPAGILTAYDMSQMELRDAALESGEPLLIHAFQTGEDVHLNTCLVIFPDQDPLDPDIHVSGTEPHKRREIGKRLNFLKLYRGGPPKIVETCRRFMGIELPLDEAIILSQRFDQRYVVLRAWQNEELERVMHDGVIILPTGWKRTLLGGRGVADRSYFNVIANYRIQTTSAQVVQSAQAMILKERELHKWTFRMPCQRHDDVWIDCLRADFPAVDRMVRHWLLNSPLWETLQDHYGRELPLGVEAKTIYPKAATR